MKTNIVIDISPTYLAKFWVSSYGPNCCQPIKLQYSLKCNIVRKKWLIKSIFCMQINIEVFCKVIVSFSVCVARQAQSTKTNQFTISLQYLEENMKDEVYSLPLDKCWKFFQIDTIISGVCGQPCPNYLK